MENDGCACRVCCLGCVARHPPKLFNSKGLSFFKVMKGDFTSFLEIPWKFAGGMQDGLCKDALLIGLNGRLWPTKLCVNNGFANFRNGWESFVSDHCLNGGDIVVFKHITHSNFIVQIFGANCYEKQCVKEESPSELCSHGGKSYARLEIISIEEENNEDARIAIVREENDTELELACNPAAVNNLAEPDLALEMEHTVSRLHSPCTAKQSKLKNVEETQNALTLTEKKISHKNFVAEAMKLVITKNPKFVKLMTESSVSGSCRLSIPRLFGKRWLQKQHDVVLNSPKHSETWVVKIQCYIRFYGLTGGWRFFVEAHNLKEGDACVFELVDKKHGIFKVHVFKGKDLQRQKLLKT